MYVRKFESDTMDGALKLVKHELGPDAIILKTITNKGIGSSFKKKKIEITAAISEKNYTKKGQVDHFLNKEEKDKFYSSDSTYISEMIDKHSTNLVEPVSTGYGRIGVNKPVKSTENNQTNELDSFLGTPDKNGQDDSAIPVEVAQVSKVDKVSSVVDDQRIYELQSRVSDLTNKVNRIVDKLPAGIVELKNTLRSLDINESFIRLVVSKAFFELTEENLEDFEVVLDFCFSKMMDQIEVSMPKFSSTNTSKTITILLSESSSGQTSQILKMIKLVPNSRLIRFSDFKQKNLTEQLLDIDVKEVESNADMISEIRKAIEESKNVFIDFKNITKEKDLSKQIIEGIKRAFDNVEILLSLSSIHSQNYNFNMLNKYQSLINGLSITHMDQCLDYGSLFNISSKSKVPLVFFGIGPVVPDDIESASKERIIAGLFEL